MENTLRRQVEYASRRQAATTAERGQETGQPSRAPARAQEAKGPTKPSKNVKGNRNKNASFIDAKRARNAPGNGQANFRAAKASQAAAHAAQPGPDDDGFFASVASFEELGLRNDLCAALSRLGFCRPSDIQVRENGLFLACR